MPYAELATRKFNPSQSYNLKPILKKRVTVIFARFLWHISYHFTQSYIVSYMCLKAIESKEEIWFFQWRIKTSKVLKSQKCCLSCENYSEKTCLDISNIE